MTHFSYPIGIILFNRPQYAYETLKSLKNQSLKIEEKQCIIIVDGFDESKDQSLGRPDQTKEVVTVAKDLFPRAQILHKNKNIGIAKMHQELEKQLLIQGSNWIVKMEEDYVLGQFYLQALEKLINSVDKYREIVLVSATGDTLINKSRGDDTLYPLRHFWAYGLRTAHARNRKKLLNEYITCMGTTPYYQRDWLKIYTFSAQNGLSPIGTSQDYFLAEVIRSWSKLAVTTGKPFGRYIGEIGENFTPEFFHKEQYDVPSFTNQEDVHKIEINEELVEVLLKESKIAYSLEALTKVFTPLNYALLELKDLKSSKKPTSEKLKFFTKFRDKVNYFIKKYFK